MNMKILNNFGILEPIRNNDEFSKVFKMIVFNYGQTAEYFIQETL